MTTMALVEQAGREASVGRNRLSLVNISLYMDKFMCAEYQQTAEMLYWSDSRTQEGNKARRASSRSPNEFKTLQWRCHII